MSSLFGIAAGGQAGDFYSHEIENSLRLNRSDSANLSRTPSSEGNRRTHTTSMWVKRSELERSARLFMSTNNSSNANYQIIGFNGSDQLTVFAATEGSTGLVSIKSNAVFRDVSAWYHIVVAQDTTQATDSNRFKIYVNGTQITSFETANYGSQNAEYRINQTSVHYINKDGSSLGNTYSTFYVADVNFIDGQQLDPTSFGETKSGVWIPKDTSGLTFGTNGFRLEFGDSSAIGDDTSGNSNDFTASNLAAIDVTLDSPTDNFATLSPLIRHETYGHQADPAPTNGNLNIAMPGGTNNIAVSTFELVPPNKYRCSFELTSRGSSTNFEFGIGSTNKETGAARVSYNSSGRIDVDGSSPQSGLTSANTVGDIVEVLVDLDANNVKFALKENGSSTWAALGTAEDISANITNPIVFVREQGSSNINGKFDFGQLGYVGSDDENYFPMSTANLPEPSISPLNDDLPEDYFDTVLYTGNSSTNSISVGFQPDWVWIKERTASSSYGVYDSVRGNTEVLSSDAVTNAYDQSADPGLESFDTDGFTVDYPNNGDYYINRTGQPYVSWNWLAGGTAVSNTDGDIDSSVSANTEAGFSIVGYTGDGTNATRTIGCGLTKKPEMVIIKNRTEDSVADTWFVWHTAFGTASPSKYMTLYDSDAVAASGVFVDSSFSDNSGNALFAVNGGYNGVNKSGTTYIAYCFHSVEGYSRFGSYTGVGNADGAYVYLGFRPAFVMIKNTSASAGWHMYDSARGTTVGNEPTLNADVSSAETTSGDRIDFTSNGFKLKVNQTNVNASGNDYIYMAFAEMPFKYANAV